WLGDDCCDPSLLALEDLVAFVVATICQCNQLAFAGCCLGELGHGRQLVPVMANVCDLVGHDHVVLGIHGRLHVVANDAGSSTTRGHGSCVGFGHRDLPVVGKLHLLANRLQCLHVLLHLGDLLLQVSDPTG